MSEKVETSILVFRGNITKRVRLGYKIGKYGYYRDAYSPNRLVKFPYYTVVQYHTLLKLDRIVI